MVLAFIFGGLIGCWLAAGSMALVFTLGYHLRFIIYGGYEGLFDFLGDDFMYETTTLTEEDGVASYRDFLLRRQEVRSEVEAEFKKIWRLYTGILLRYYGGTLIVAMLVFWNHFWYFLLAFVLAHLGYYFYFRWHRQPTRLYYMIVLHDILVRGGPAS